MGRCRGAWEMCQAWGKGWPQGVVGWCWCWVLALGRPSGAWQQHRGLGAVCAGKLLLEVESEGEVHRRFMLGVGWAGQEGRGAGWCWTLACKDAWRRAQEAMREATCVCCVCSWHCLRWYELEREQDDHVPSQSSHSCRGCRGGMYKQTTTFIEAAPCKTGFAVARQA